MTFKKNLLILVVYFVLSTSSGFADTFRWKYSGILKTDWQNINRLEAAFCDNRLDIFLTVFANQSVKKISFGSSNFGYLISVERVTFSSPDSKKVPWDNDLNLKLLSLIEQDPQFGDQNLFFKIEFKDSFFSMLIHRVMGQPPVFGLVKEKFRSSL